MPVLCAHGAASIDLTTITSPAKPEEYADLLEELQSIGYDNLVIAHHFTYRDFLSRKAEIKAL